jgi:hypothetical protein
MKAIFNIHNNNRFYKYGKTIGETFGEDRVMEDLC